jgi:hypothetical protein
MFFLEYYALRMSQSRGLPKGYVTVMRNLLGYFFEALTLATKFHDISFMENFFLSSNSFTIWKYNYGFYHPVANR